MRGGPGEVPLGKALAFPFSSTAPGSERSTCAGWARSPLCTPCCSAADRSGISGRGKAARQRGDACDLLAAPALPGGGVSVSGARAAQAASLNRDWLQRSRPPFGPAGLWPFWRRVRAGEGNLRFFQGLEASAPSSPRSSLQTCGWGPPSWGISPLLAMGHVGATQKHPLLPPHACVPVT